MRWSSDSLRAHVILSWFVGIALSYASIGLVVLFNDDGLVAQDLAPTARDLFAAVAPSFVALIGAYFSSEIKTVRLTKGQRRVLLTLSYSYVSAFTLITMMIVTSEALTLNHDAVGDIPQTNQYSWLTYLQPIVIAPLFFLFGKSSAAQD